jgi:Rieske Fe-S protein
MRRRDFVRLGAGAVGLGALPGCAAFVATPVTPLGGEIRLALRDHPQLGQPGGYLRIRLPDAAAPLYVFAQGGGAFAVVSPICTHLQCVVNIEGAQLLCPCHGSVFDRAGNVLRGPAERPLRRYPARVTEDGNLVIRYEGGAA